MAFLVRWFYWSLAVITSILQLTALAIEASQPGGLSIDICANYPMPRILIAIDIVLRSVLACLQLPAHLLVLDAARCSKRCAGCLTDKVLGGDGQRFYGLLRICNHGLLSGSLWTGWMCVWYPFCLTGTGWPWPLLAVFVLNTTAGLVWLILLLIRKGIAARGQTHHYFYLNHELPQES